MFSNADVIEHAHERLIKKQGETAALDDVLADFDRWYRRRTGIAVDWSMPHVREVFKSYFLLTGFSEGSQQTNEGVECEVVYDAMLRE